MNVCLTGSEGHVGQAVILELGMHGHSVSNYDLKIGLDIHDHLRLFQELRDCDAVVHLAAIPGPEPVTFRRYFDVNIAGTFAVANAAAHAGVKRLVFASSTGYYGLEQSIGRTVPIGDETSPSVLGFAKPSREYLPHQLFYGASKVCCEDLLAVFGIGMALQVVVLRFAPMPGCFGLRLSHAKAAEAVRLALEHPDELWFEVFNICSSPGLDSEKAKRVLRWVP